MRVFRVKDGTSWIARADEAAEQQAAAHTGWEAIIFEADPATIAQRLVYRPAGWLASATFSDLVSALEEADLVRARWGEAS